MFCRIGIYAAYLGIMVLNAHIWLMPGISGMIAPEVVNQIGIIYIGIAVALPSIDHIVAIHFKIIGRIHLVPLNEGFQITQFPLGVGGWIAIDHFQTIETNR